MNRFSRYFLELIVITVSVLSAFWLENVREDRRTKQRQTEAINHILVELKTNKRILEENIRTLRDFNQSYLVVDSLVGTKGERKLTEEEIENLRSRFPDNPRIQNLGTLTADSLYLIGGGDVAIDFFLQRMNFGMWESAKSSGTLIGMNSNLVQSLFYACFFTLMLTHPRFVGETREKSRKLRSLKTVLMVL